MLDEGLRAGLSFCGIDYHTVCYVEREAYAASVLVARMEDGLLDKAPIWDDLLTFDGQPWRGVVDCITAGFPCQPHSIAGKRQGLADERWIWPDIARTIREVGPKIVWLENVPGLASTGGLAQCLRDLSILGYDAQWSVLAASDVGARHKRSRLFILAYQPKLCLHRDQVANAKSPRLPQHSNQAKVRQSTRFCEIPLFAPGPAADWTAICAEFPFLAPEVKPGFRVLVDGLAVVVDESRADQLRAIGNGVVPAQAAIAFILLAQRASLI